MLRVSSLPVQLLKIDWSSEGWESPLFPSTSVLWSNIIWFWQVRGRIWQWLSSDSLGQWQTLPLTCLWSFPPWTNIYSALLSYKIYKIWDLVFFLWFQVFPLFFLGHRPNSFLSFLFCFLPIGSLLESWPLMVKPKLWMLLSSSPHCGMPSLFCCAGCYPPCSRSFLRWLATYLWHHQDFTHWLYNTFWHGLEAGCSVEKM